jgi:hypothetical protein
MSFKENRMVITKSELNNLNEWVSRLNYDVSSIELRTGMEPGIGHALTAYVQLHDSEGYFKLLTTAPNSNINLANVEEALKNQLRTSTVKTSETN